MKTPHLALTLATTLAIALTALPAKAGFLCGELEQRIVRPHCGTGQFCAPYVRVAHVLVMGENKIELQAASSAVLEQLVQTSGSAICVDGQQSPQAKFFEVTVVYPLDTDD